MSESVNEKMSSTHSLTNSSSHPPSSPSEIAIRVDHVSKKFCRYLRKSMRYGIQDISRNLLGMSTKPDRLRKHEFWAVDDVSFELHRGETLGLIGPNGSGKSTILKMLNGIFMLDKGKIEISGRVGALIEIGAGFHPLLTGRENIYVNGAILGMSKKEIDGKFDDIVEFADIGDFLDTPVKFYSSGMFVRLGFAVAVHCEPDILLVDEVLAVGDINFQSKCFNKIGELMSRGTTTVLVAHNMVSIRRICDRCVWLNAGKIMMGGDSIEVCDAYQFMTMEGQEKTLSPNDENDEGLHIEKVFFRGQGGDERSTFGPDEPISVGVLVNPRENIVNPTIEIKLKSLTGIEILHVIEQVDASFSPNSREVIEFRIDRLPLTNDIVYINFLLWNHDRTKLFARRSGNYSFRMVPKGHIEGQLSVNYEVEVGKYVENIRTQNS